MEHIDRRYPSLEEKRYGNIEPGDIPLFNLGEDAGAIGED